MRKLLCLIFLASPAFATFTWCVPVTFTNPTATTLTNFPALFCANGGNGAFCDSVNHSNLVLAILKGTGSGGSMTSASGYDAVWYSDAACNTTTVPFQLVTYATATGIGEWWVNIASLTGSGSVTLYLGVGNAAITTDQSSTSTWNSNFKRVYHFKNGSTLSLVDATSNAVTAVQAGLQNMVAVTGQVDGGILDSTGNSSPNFAYLTISDTGLPSGASPITVEGWVAANANQGMDGSGYVYWLGSNAANSANLLYINTLGGICPSSVQRAEFLFGGGVSATVATSAGVYCWPKDQWHHFTVTNDGTTARIYVDGVADGTANSTAWSTSLTGTLVFNKSNTAFGDYACGANAHCEHDEFRVSSGVQVADWVAANYATQSAPWNFFNIGTPLGSGGVKHKVNSN